MNHLSQNQEKLSDNSNQNSKKLEQLSHQLQQEIKKNKNLLQTNFTLMEENQLYITSFTKLKNHINSSENQCEESVMADEVEELVNVVIQKINLSNMYSETISNANYNKDAQGQKKCECLKWKQLYLKQSEQTFRISEHSNDLKQKINRLHNLIKEDRQEVQYILNNYLKLFKRVNSIDFLKAQSCLEEKSEAIIDKERKKSKQNCRINNNSAQKKSKQTNSSKNKQSSHSKNKKNSPQIKSLSPLMSIDQIPKNWSQIQYLQQLTKYCDSLISQNRDLREETAQLREQISNREILLRIYRQKERGQYLTTNYSQYHDKFLQDL